MTTAKRAVARWALGEAESEKRLAGLAALTLGSEPLRAVDIGARDAGSGDLTPIEGQVELHGFEPEPAECEALNRRAAERRLTQRFHPVAVAGGDEVRTFRETRAPRASSLLEPEHDFHRRFPEPERMEVVNEVELEVRSLGGVLEEQGFRPEFVKVDAQGVDGEILDSLSDPQWEELLGVHAEVLFAPLYRGQTWFSQIDELLRSHGMSLFSLRRYTTLRRGFDFRKYEARAQLIFGDALYLRTDASMRPEMRRRLALLAALHAHYDYALELLGEEDERAAAVVRKLARRRPRPIRTMARALRSRQRFGGTPPSPWASDTPDAWV